MAVNVIFYFEQNYRLIYFYLIKSQYLNFCLLNFKILTIIYSQIDPINFVFLNLI